MRPSATTARAFGACSHLHRGRWCSKTTHRVSFWGCDVLCAVCCASHAVLCFDQDAALEKLRAGESRAVEHVALDDDETHGLAQHSTAAAGAAVRPGTAQHTAQAEALEHAEAGAGGVSEGKRGTKRAAAQVAGPAGMAGQAGGAEKKGRRVVQ